MSNKNGFDPSIRDGIQIYWDFGERITVVHPDGYIDLVDQGSVLLFETKSVGSERMYWFGRATNTCFWLVLERPVTIFEVSSWFRAQSEMILAHNGDLDEFTDMQGELPF